MNTMIDAFEMKYKYFRILLRDDVLVSNTSSAYLIKKTVFLMYMIKKITLQKYKTCCTFSVSCNTFD